MVEFLEIHKITFEQYSFQKNKLTTLAILDLYTKVTNALDNNKSACSVFLDFAKAFETVNHEILIKKLENYGIRGIAYKWFTSYLQNRYQVVLIYINDTKKSLKILTFYLFADDTSTLLTRKSVKGIENIYNHKPRGVAKSKETNIKHKQVKFSSV